MKNIFITLLIAAVSQLQAQNVGIGTNTPFARLHVTDSAVLFSGSVAIPPFATTINPPVQGAGTRMLWYPALGAFRTGYVNGVQWDKDSIGQLSFAAGSNTKAKGNASVAMGYNTSALNSFSTSLGGSTIASGIMSTSMGGVTLASGAYATAMGFGTTASGFRSTAMGDSSLASGEKSTAMGHQTIASGFYSTATGLYNTASGNGSLVAGTFAVASGDVAIALGRTTSAIGRTSFSAGNNTITKASGSTVFGAFNDDTDNPDPVNETATDRIFQLGNGDRISHFRSNAITILRNGNTGLGNTDPGFRMDINGRMRIRSGGDLNNTAGLWLNNTNNTAQPAFIGMQNNEQVGFYGNTSGWSFVMNTTTGKIGMGTTTPAATLDVNGFTKLGNDAPSIKVKKLTGTTASTEGGDVNIPHGLTFSKILSVSVLVESQTTTYTPPSYTTIPGYEYNYDVYNSTVWIFNIAGNSGNILSKPVKIMITYEE